MRRLLTSFVIFAAAAPLAAAQDLYLTSTLDQLNFVGEAPRVLARPLTGSELGFRPHVRAVVTGAYAQNVEAWVAVPFVETFADGAPSMGAATLAVRIAADSEHGTLNGTLYVPGRRDGDPAKVLAFTMDSADASPEGREDFLRARYLSSSWLLARQAPGAALWRRIAEADGEELELVGSLPVFDPNRRLFSRRGARTEVQDAYGLFSGGQALSENLALDLVLEPEEGTEGWQPISELRGIETPAVDWGEALEQADPDIDALAHLIPSDQMFVHLAGLGELRALVAMAVSEVPWLLELFESTGSDGNLMARYERQLALSLDATTELFAKATVRGLALTASDPFLRTGTDLALVFETDGSPLLAGYVRAQHEAALRANPKAEALEATHGGVTYTGVRSRWRELCSYLVELPGGIVAVSNSPAQIHALIDTHAKSRPAVSELAEYLVYRDRYPAAEGEAFVLISDETIRRWASPRWRIGAARRTRAAAVMADEAAGQLLRDSGADGPRALRVRDNLRVPGGDRLVRRPRGAASPVYGTPEFLTPVVELDIESVTAGEVAAYSSFRRTYENRWRDVFDPVGARVVLGEDSFELDLSVRPLTRRSEYRSLIELVEGGSLAPTAGIRGEGILGQLVYAMDSESRAFQDFQGMASSFAPKITSSFAWVGDHMTVYLDDGPFWKEMAAAEDPERWFEEHVFDMPMGVKIACKSPLQLAGFLAGFRGFVEETAPGLVRWESREYGEHRYLALIPETDMGMPGLDLYYATRPDALILGMTPGVIERALDRIDAGEGSKGPVELGEHALGTITPAGLRFAAQLWTLENREDTQLRAWDALPLWDELHRRFPHEDPALAWARYFPSVPTLPGGDRMQWNIDEARYESLHCGTPDAPRATMGPPAIVERLKGVAGGLTFEEGDGLRARVKLSYTPR